MMLLMLLSSVLIEFVILLVLFRIDRTLRSQLT